MGALVGVAIGVVSAVFGFSTMRNPLIFGVLFPFAKGYYQRLMLDTLLRIQLRVLGALICLFGGSIGTHSLAALMKSSWLDAVGEALFVLLIFVFACAFCAGLVLGIWQTYRGELFDWLRIWRTGIQLGTINMVPSITPKMQREARLFVLIFCVLVSVATLAALLQ